MRVSSISASPIQVSHSSLKLNRSRSANSSEQRPAGSAKKATKTHRSSSVKSTEHRHSKVDRSGTKHTKPAVTTTRTHGRPTSTTSLKKKIDHNGRARHHSDGKSPVRSDRPATEKPKNVDDTPIVKKTDLNANHGKSDPVSNAIDKLTDQLEKVNGESKDLSETIELLEDLTSKFEDILVNKTGQADSSSSTSYQVSRALRFANTAYRLLRAFQPESFADFENRFSDITATLSNTTSKLLNQFKDSSAVAEANSISEDTRSQAKAYVRSVIQEVIGENLDLVA